MRVLRGLLAASWIAVLSIGLFHGCSSEPAQTGSVDSPPAAKTRTVVVPPPVLSTLTDVALLDRKGNDFGPQEFGGKVWITNFIFTRCAGVCPRQSEALSKLQPTLAAMADSDRLGWMSVSVDPEFDRPEVMDAYGSRWNADPRWRFLTGTRKEIWAWVKEGFRLPVSDNPEPNGMPILHSSKFVLVDAQGRVRGYYESLEPDGLARLPQDLQFVLDEQEDALAEAAEAAAASPLPKRREPENDRPAEWLAQRAKAQKEAASGLENPLDFWFVDRRAQSGIGFVHRAVEDAGKTYKAVHYDHGNSVSAADVDGDDRIDLYFISQVGRSELWRNLGDGKFEEITDRAGVAIGDRVAVGASFADIDNDGDADLYVTALRTGNLLFENDGTGRFNEVTRKSGLGYKGHSSAALFFDFDRDGLLDLFLANVGAYTSADVRKVESDGRPYEFYDGLKDAFGGHLKPERTERSLLFHNDGAGKFTDVTDALGLDEPSWTGDATPMDPNEDGWPDLYVLNMQGHDQYWENQEGKRFVKRSRELFPKTPWGSMGAMRFDYNNDGRFDLYITDMHSDMSQEVGIDQEKQKSEMAWPASFTRTGDNSIFGNALFVGTGTDLFSEESDALGAETYWPWGCSVGDLNADGFDDIFVTGGMSYPFRYGINSVLMNDQGRKFVDSEFVLNVEPRRRARTEQPWFTLDCIGADKSHKLCAGRSGELEALGTLSTRTSVLLDIEGDGDLDIVTGDFHSPPMVLISNLAQRHEIRYLEIALEGVKSNRNGLGVVVRVRMQDGTKMMKVNDGKSGYLSQSLLPLYFGLGNREVASIEVSWPSGVVQQVATPIQANSRLRIREDG